MTTLDIDRIRDLEVEGASDSRPCMKDTLLKILGLDADASDEKIVEAVKSRVGLADIAKALELKDDATEQDVLDAIKSKDEPEANEVSLEDKAKAEGKVVIGASDFAALKVLAENGDKAAKELHQTKFDTAFETALDEVRVDAKDGTRKSYQALYDKAPEETIAILEKLPKVASTEGRGHGRTKPGGEAPENVDEDRHDLDNRAKAYAKEHKVSYTDALSAVIEEGEV